MDGTHCHLEDAGGLQWGPRGSGAGQVRAPEALWEQWGKGTAAPVSQLALLRWHVRPTWPGLLGFQDTVEIQVFM